MGAPVTRRRGHKHLETRRRNEGPHRGARCWNELFPVFPAEMRLFPVPTGTENMSNIKGLRLFFGSVPGVPGVLCRHPSAERSKGTPVHRLARVHSAARAGEFCRPAWGVPIPLGGCCAADGGNRRPVCITTPPPGMGPFVPVRGTGHSRREKPLAHGEQKGWTVDGGRWTVNALVLACSKRTARAAGATQCPHHRHGSFRTRSRCGSFAARCRPVSWPAPRG